MPIRNADAEWKGDLKGGAGKVKLGSGAFEGTYGFASRFETGPGTNPEELIAAAHAGCYSMALSHTLAEAGHKPTRVHTTAKVHLEKVPDGFAITKIELVTECRSPASTPRGSRSTRSAPRRAARSPRPSPPRRSRSTRSSSRPHSASSPERGSTHEGDPPAAWIALFYWATHRSIWDRRSALF